MSVSFSDLLCLGVALAGILLTGSAYLRLNVSFYALQTFLMCLLTAAYGYQRHEPHLYALAVALFVLKTLVVPNFLGFIISKVGVRRDRGMMLPTALSMHLALVFVGLAYVLACQLPPPPSDGASWTGATAAISLFFTGLIIMLTRRIAVSQVIGFLVMENGIYIFALTQTLGMPLIIEMGVLLDVLVAVMIAGLIAFRIQKSFEHLDVAMLKELRE